jgi:hypothetical protein
MAPYSMDRRKRVAKAWDAGRGCRSGPARKSLEAEKMRAAFESVFEVGHKPFIRKVERM